MREARAITLLGKQRPEKPLVEPEVQRRCARAGKLTLALLRLRMRCCTA
jgi:hypothetical protein